MAEENDKSSGGWPDAVTEIAKTLSDYEKHAPAIGQFIADIIGHPARQIGGFVGDSVAILRSEVMFKFIPRYRRKLAELGVESPKALSIGIAYPLLEAASLETDDDLSDMFAGLLATYVNEVGTEKTPKSFIDTVKSMTPIEAQIMKSLWTAREIHKDNAFRFTHELPAVALPVPDARKGLDKSPEPSLTVKVALASMQRLGCIVVAQSIDGDYHYQQVRLSFYGEQLAAASLI